MAQPSTCFEVEATAPGLSAAKLTQTLHQRGEEERVWVCSTASGQWVPILCCAHQLSCGAPSPRTATSKGNPCEGQQRGVMAQSPLYQSPLPKEPPDPAPEHCTWCNRSTVMQGTVSNLPPSGETHGHSHLPKCILIHGIPYFKAGDPHHQGDHTEGNNEASLEPMDR